MAADSAYYLDQLYPLQDKVLRVITECDTDFYLTGGTALSRVYLHHRFSDDLDPFRQLRIRQRHRSALSALLRRGSECPRLERRLANPSYASTALLRARLCRE